jgi:2-dehydropantoate 2-reductase
MPCPEASGTNEMKIAIVGTGAMGSVYAALLGTAGHEIWAIDAWQAHVDAIGANGLRLEGASGDRTVRLHATTDAKEVGPCDLVIIATKVMHVAQAAEATKALLGKNTLVLSIQNGLGGPDTAARVLGRERVLVGVVGGFGASMKGPGHAHHNGWELVRLGEFAGPVSPRLERIAEVWRSGGFKVKCFDDIDQLVWEKLICNVCYSGTCAITERTLIEVIDDPDVWKVASGCAKEAFAVAKARGVKLEIDDCVEYVRAFGVKMPNARPSMLLDHMAGRASEIDAINGAIPPAAEAEGGTAPYNEVISGLVRGKERRMGLRKS